MGNGISFKTISPDDLKRLLKGLEKDVKEESQKALKAKSIEILETARNMAPIRDGNLRAAINLKINRNQWDKSKYTIYTVDNVNGVNVSDYLFYIHYNRYKPSPEGWRNLGKKSKTYNGNPEEVGGYFMDRALAKHQEDVFAKIEKAIQYNIRF